MLRSSIKKCQTSWQSSWILQSFLQIGFILCEASGYLLACSVWSNAESRLLIGALYLYRRKNIEKERDWSTSFLTRIFSFFPINSNTARIFCKASKYFVIKDPIVCTDHNYLFLSVSLSISRMFFKRNMRAKSSSAFHPSNPTNHWNTLTDRGRNFF